ncbi:hypothetical protein HNR15_003403 [Allobranchiibius huperziae]|uniref:DUF3072 domain-containing protein n=1 Tax=Allobranchiibius huperziae TaxID=1874116 RepID=A0A853DPD4_9MICO|nr:hypothetical protein [Allobranchiibius huperziae]
MTDQPGVTPEETPVPAGSETIPDQAADGRPADTSQAGPTDAAAGGETIGASTPQHQEGLEKDPSDWVTGDEPMTAAQRSYLDTLAKESGEQLPADLTKAQASEHIDRLQGKSPRVD